ncbi:deoxyribose-phosphate aldolase [Christensenella intestinihominis]|uniref:deoxyribose-phosphate aldolase n=1 Tax=Christensenella intestinihominis TaxID=1851429 RepID=UPI00082EC81D|nr:deoxyribose-phosphate aldolase [Christensenella intestinihominis]
MNNQLTFETLPGIVDISALSVPTTEADVAELARAANQYGFIAAFVMPCNIEYLKRELGPDTRVIMGAPIGFPTGTDLTQDKVFQVKEMKKLGCTEFDMVLSVSKLKSGKLGYVKDDIAAVIEAADGFPVKVILEVTYLTDDEIRAGSDIVAESGAQYVKTGTGYSAKPTEVRHVELMKQAVGDRVKIKVAGGVRDFDTLQRFYDAGARRFGIGMKSAINILESIRNQ